MEIIYVIEFMDIQKIDESLIIITTALEIPFMYLHYDKTLYLRQSWLDPAEQSAKDAGRGHPLKPDELLYRKVKSNILATAMDNAKVDGLILEFGVGWGESIRVLGKLTDQYIDGFDSWQGLPEPWGAWPEKSFSTYGRVPPVPDNVTLHSGWFKDSIPKFKKDHNQPIRLLHIDCDLYSSTNTILTELGNQIVPGTIIIFDEFVGISPDFLEHEYKAFQEAVDHYGWKYEYIPVGFLNRDRTLAGPQAVVRINE